MFVLLENINIILGFGLILIVKAQQEGAFDLVRPTQDCSGYGNITQQVITTSNK